MASSCWTPSKVAKDQFTEDELKLLKEAADEDLRD